MRTNESRPPPAGVPPNIHNAAANTDAVIQPSVPVWTCVKITWWLNSTMSVPFKIPITTV
jgi:hypothetical protein